MIRLWSKSQILNPAFCFLTITSASVAFGQASYGDAVGKALISAIVPANERSAWKPVGYPTDNFGIGTLYDGKGAGSLLCATSTCLGLADGKTETLRQAGYIEAGTGGSITLTDTQKQSLGLNLVLKLFAILNLTGKYDSSKSTIVDVTVSSATVRNLIKGKLSAHIESAPPTPATKDAYDKRRIRAIASDIVVESLTTTVKIDNSADASVTATLDNGVGSVLAKDSSLGVSYTKGVSGNYVIKVSGPVIVAVAPLAQKKTTTLEAEKSASWEDWQPDTSLALKTDAPKQ